MKNEDRNDRLKELQSKLNSVVVPENLHSPEVLEISTELDDLIVGYYSYAKEPPKEIC